MRLEKWQKLDDQAVVISRALAMDAVQKVGNGHPGTAMSLAPVAYTLFQRILKLYSQNAVFLIRPALTTRNLPKFYASGYRKFFPATLWQSRRPRAKAHYYA